MVFISATDGAVLVEGKCRKIGLCVYSLIIVRVKDHLLHYISNAAKSVLVVIDWFW